MRLLIGFVLGVLALELVVADNFLSRWEYGKLLSATDRSETVKKDFSASVYQVVGSIPTGGFSNQADRQSLIERLQKTCGASAAEMQTARADMEDLGVAPWHAQIARARARYLSHEDAWLAILRACAQEPIKYNDAALQSQITATFQVAAAAYRAALPAFAPSDQVSHVEQIFKPGS